MPTVNEICSFPFNEEGLEQVRSTRMSPHLKNEEKKQLEVIEIVFDGKYNKSVVLDYEQRLIKYCSVDRRFKNILNKNKGQQAAHDYFNRKFYRNQFGVDHFIPWSFVMNDELWNLMPMDSSLNSAKNNRLPDWNDFFIRFAKNQYIMYEMIHEREGIRKLYEACYKDNLHSIWANQELYRKGNSDTEFYGILEKNMRPVYDSARRQGYDVWERRLAV